MCEELSISYVIFPLLGRGCFLKITSGKEEGPMVRGYKCYPQCNIPDHNNFDENFYKFYKWDNISSKDLYTQMLVMYKLALLCFPDNLQWQVYHQTIQYTQSFC